MIAVFVPGICAPQGSKRHLGNGILVEQSKRVKPWRADVRSALLDDQGKPRAQFDGPIHIELEFVMKRPAGAPKRSTPPAIKRPDLDKLQRAIFDAVSSAGIWRDDSQVVSVTAVKRLAKIGETPGCHLEIMDAKQKEEAVAATDR